MSRASVRIVAAFLVAVTLLAGLPSHVAADDTTTGDAGTGSDAGDTLASATSIASGSYAGGLTRGDVDWYSLSDSGAAPACLKATWASGRATTGTLVTDAFTISTSAPAGATGQLSLAIDGDAQHAFGIVANDQTRGASYAFSLVTVPVPSTDAGSGADAGDSTDAALPVSEPCFGGHLSLLDNKDTYAIHVNAPGRYALSLASSVNALGVSVLDGANNILASTSAPGSLTLNLPSAGTYYVSAQRSTLSTMDIAYAISFVTDPPSCSPAC